MNGKKEKRKGTKNEENTSAKQWDGSEISNVSINTQLFVSSFDYTTSQERPREDNYFHASKFSRLESVEFREKNCYPLSSRLERGTRRCKVE